jgi:hypothetical protein
MRVGIYGFRKWRKLRGTWFDLGITHHAFVAGARAAAKEAARINRHDYANNPEKLVKYEKQ